MSDCPFSFTHRSMYTCQYFEYYVQCFTVLLWLKRTHEKTKLLDIPVNGSHTESNLPDMEARELDMFSSSDGWESSAASTAVQQRYAEGTRYVVDLSCLREIFETVEYVVSKHLLYLCPVRFLLSKK